MYMYASNTGQLGGNRGARCRCGCKAGTKRNKLGAHPQEPSAMRRLLLTVVLLFGAWAAQADNGLFYVGAGVGKDTNSEFNGTPWKVLAGFRPISLFAVEAD